MKGQRSKSSRPSSKLFAITPWSSVVIKKKQKKRQDQCKDIQVFLKLISSIGCIYLAPH